VAGTAPAAGGSSAAGTGVATAPSLAAPAGTATPGATIAGYRLSGNDMSSWLGQRVQIVGSVVRPTAPAGASASASGATGTSSAALMPELRVTSVQAMSGPCPER
jgi:hypothetical protein